MIFEMKEAVRSLISEFSPHTDADAASGRVLRFYDALCIENKFQNLTRLISPEDFIEGHLLDVLHLEKSGFLEIGQKPFDLGSGGGVPGLLHYEAFTRPWTLCDSEKLKADFLSRYLAEYSVNDVEVVDSRAEVWLTTHDARQIVTRAVGKVGKVMSWIEKCSTWNNLILFKGPGWAEEWKEFNRTRFRAQLKIDGEYSYTVGKELKTRHILMLTRI